MEFYRLTWTRIDGVPKLKFLVWDPDEKKKDVVYLDFEFMPYFFIKDTDLNPGIEKWVEGYGGKITRSFVNDFAKIELPTPDLVGKFKREHSVQTWEADIPYSRRVMIDLDLSIGNPINKLYFDIEVSPGEGVPDPKKADQRIISIAAVDDRGNEYFFCEDDERKMIREFLKLCDRYVVVVGYFCGRFDVPYLKARCKKLGIEYDWFKFLYLDLFSIYKYMLKKTAENYKLVHIAELELGETKYIDLEKEGAVDKLDEWFKNNREELRKYNMQDALLCKKLDDKLSMVDLAFRVAQISHTTFDDIFVYNEKGKRDVLFSVIIDSLVLNISKKRGKDRIIFPNRRGGDREGSSEESYTGGYVKEPYPGIHRNVVVLDFSGAYNTAFKVLNIGFETWRPDKSGEIKVVHGSFVKNPRGIFAETVGVLEKLRAEYKSKRAEFEPGTDEWKVYDTLQFAVKTILLSVTGVLGYSSSRFYKKELIENATLMVRDCIQFVEQVVEEELGFRVVAGDTDSIFVKVYDELTVKPKVELPRGNIVEKAVALRDYLNQRLREYCEVMYNSEPLELGIDKIYSKLFVFPAKKRYAGIVIYEDGKPCLYIKYVGIEAVRRDTLPAVREFQKELLKLILTGHRMSEIIQYARDVKQKLFNGELDEGLVTWEGLNKPLEEYEVDQPHVRVAKMLKERGTPVRVGDKIAYIVYGPRKTDIVPYGVGKVRIPPEGYEFIWNNRFMPILERLGLAGYFVGQTKLEGFGGGGKKFIGSGGLEGIFENP